MCVYVCAFVFALIPLFACVYMHVCILLYMSVYVPVFLKLTCYAFFHCRYVSCVLGCPYEGDIQPEKVAEVSEPLSSCNVWSSCQLDVGEGQEVGGGEEV